ncbi:MAG: hypothetical protein R3314_05740 [Longimicrobiales bacterium]|nr:hypothetical protein [Longimicrobiales bacterium]
MNYTRILLGGLLAGVVINLSEFLLNGVVLMDAMEAELELMDAAFAPWAMPFYVVMAFLWGIAMVWLYAAIRPRFGPGWRTAVMVGVFFWVFVTVLPTFANMAMGIAMEGLVGIGLIWTLVELPAAAVVGSWLYQEGVGVGVGTGRARV